MGYAEEAMKQLHGQSEVRFVPSAKNATLDAVAAELAQARQTHAPMHSHHEGYAVILEELDELWEVCKMNTHPRGSQLHQGMTVEMLRKQKRAAMRKEALQVAAMAIRFIEDICDKEGS
jgi:hypothetical protein